MTGEMEALARRAVACKGWRWMPGMLSDHGRIVEINVYGLLVGYTTGIILKSGDQGWPRGWQASASLRMPDLTDPATLGCLLALVREAWGDECAGTAYDEFADGWFFKSRVGDGDGGNVCLLGRFLHEAEALVAALEATP